MIRIALSQAFHNKALKSGYPHKAWANSFIATETTMQGLFEHVTSGSAFTVSTCEDNYRDEKKFKASSIMALDFDNNVSIQDCLNHPFISRYVSFIYPSASSGNLDDSGNPVYKSRPVFQLDRTITGLHTYKRLVLALMYACQDLAYDPSCKDGVRLFFGSTNRYEEPVFIGHILSVDALETIADEMEAEHGTQDEPRTEEMNILIRAKNTERLKDGSHKTILERYASVALDNMIGTLSTLGQGGGRYGGRNNTAFVYGAKCGNFIAAGMLDSVEAETSLIRAALSSGLAEFEAKTAVSNGILQGMETPFDIQSLLNKWESNKTKPSPAIDLMYEKPALPGGGYYVGLPKEDKPRPKSWIEQKYIPREWIKIVSSLIDGRSAVLGVFLQMHHAFYTGLLNPDCFTKRDVIDTLGLARKSTEAAIETMLEWGFCVEFIDYIYIDKLESETTQNSKGGRPATQYRINNDTDYMRVLLSDMKARYITEQYSKKTLAPRHANIAHEIGLDKSDWKVWKERTEAALDPRANHEICNEIEYYREAVWNDDYFEYDLTDVKSSKDIRILLVVDFLSQPGHEDGVIITDEKLARYLGCSTPNVHHLLKASNAATDARRAHHEVNNPHEAILDIEIANAQRQHQGTATGILFKRISTGKWGRAFGAENMQKVFYQNRTDMIRLIIHVEQPSLKRFMNADEWMAKYKVEDEIISDNDKVEVETAKINSTQNPPKVKRTPSQKTTKDRNWSHYDTDWLREQLRLEFHLYTNDRLTQRGAIMTENGNLLRYEHSFAAVVKYLNENASKNPLRSIASYYNTEQESDVDTLIGQMQALGGQVRDDSVTRKIRTTENEAENHIIPNLVQNESEVVEKIHTSVQPEKALSITEQKRRETLALLKAKSRRDYLEQRAGA